MSVGGLAGQLLSASLPTLQLLAPPSHAALLSAAAQHASGRATPTPLDPQPPQPLHLGAGGGARPPHDGGLAGAQQLLAGVGDGGSVPPSLRGTATQLQSLSTAQLAELANQVRPLRRTHAHKHVSTPAHVLRLACLCAARHLMRPVAGLRPR